MTVRYPLLTLAGLLVGGLTATSASATDFGISFHYSSYAPACYGSQYYASYCPSYYPQSYVYYADYCEPLLYAGCSTPRVIVYSGCYPTTYRTTYTRSRYYTRPVRRAHTSICYRSGHYGYDYGTRKVCDHHYRTGSTYRRDCGRSRPSWGAYTSRDSGLRYRSSDSFSRLRSSLYSHRDRHARHQSSRYRYHRTPGSWKIRR
jgi:hypothetical protein